MFDAAYRFLFVFFSQVKYEVRSREAYQQE